MKVKTVSVSCPQCSKPVLMTSEFPYRPFCSKRCKDIDFGAWATEEFKIPGGDEEGENWSEET